MSEEPKTNIGTDGVQVFWIPDDESIKQQKGAEQDKVENNEEE